jgi:hypothetical protein
MRAILLLFSFLLVLIPFPHSSSSSPSYSSRDLLAKFLIDLKPVQEGKLWIII